MTVASDDAAFWIDARIALEKNVRIKAVKMFARASEVIVSSVKSFQYIRLTSGHESKSTRKGRTRRDLEMSSDESPHDGFDMSLIVDD